MTIGVRHRFTICIFLSMILYGCVTQKPPAYGEIEGYVLNFDGSPLVEAKISVIAPSYYGRHPSNYEGAYHLTGVPTGKWNIEFHCPSANYIGRRISTEEITVRENYLSKVDIQVPEMYCYEPPYAEVSSTYYGYISHGFENSGFISCHEESLNLSKNLFSNKAYIWAGITQGLYSEFQQDTLYFVKIKGSLKGPGSFGHLGVSLYLMEIDSVMVKKEVAQKDCAKHVQDAS